ncbi:hypothetical protein CEXT_111451 [Caerostris extrusa]|uniref:Uncharacterized protein n=1 Tax=Caerostris extrusa TaxID=172846 RepID=A0AAV4SCB3_CAEEX|nr:hypothetical protein CEXT_111451 [Caerostris extrusa]
MKQQLRKRKEQNSNNKPKRKRSTLLSKGLFAEEKDGDRYEYRSWAVDWTRAKGRFIRMLMERSLMRFLYTRHSPSSSTTLNPAEMYRVASLNADDYFGH